MRPRARYAIPAAGEERRGAWLPDDQPLPAGWSDTFDEPVARALLPLLRDLEGRAAGKGGRRAAEPTSPDGELIARACKALGLTMGGLAGAVGVSQSQLSRAMAGELPTKHREAIKRLLKPT